MIFDPFGDYDCCGYLRNKAGLYDIPAVKKFEHAAFLDKLEEALTYLAKLDKLNYDDVLKTHKIIFEDVYPWAGEDRTETSPGIPIRKGSVLYAHSNDARAAIMYALRIGQVGSFMANKPGEIMGYFAYAHPFLDGNELTMMIVHAELAQRAGISLDWASIGKDGYLAALTRELDRPGIGLLDAYLKPFTGPAVGYSLLATLLTRCPGLDGKPKQQTPAN